MTASEMAKIVSETAKTVSEMANIVFCCDLE